MSASPKPALQPIAQGSAPPVPDDEEDADADDETLLVVPPLVAVEAASLVVNEPPLPPVPPAPPGPLFDPVPPPAPVLSLVTVPEEAQPVLRMPKIKDRVDPRTSWWRMMGDSAEIRRVYKPLRHARRANRVDARLATLHHRATVPPRRCDDRRRLCSASPFHPIEAPRMLKADHPRIFFLCGLALTLGAATCSATGSNTSASTEATGTGAGGDAPITTSATTATTGSSASTGGDAGPDPDAACGLITEEAKSTPLDLYIAFDRSSSMVGNKWDSAKLGLTAFVNDPDSAGIEVALNFFPLESKPTTCMQSDYGPPKVDFAPLPGNAKLITDAMALAMPTGFATPIYPALGGAILDAKAYAQAHSGHVAAVLLVTDGAPQGPAAMCGNVNPEDPKAIADLAAAGVSYGIKTFVVGLPGVDPLIANQIALAGGTDTAIVVSSFDVKTEFQKALAKVRGEALPCEYVIPDKVEGGDVNPGDVNVLVTPSGGNAAILPQDVMCSALGWRYDSPTKPTKIIFCPASCQSLKTDFGAKVQILLGCKTEVAK
jgi:hypothetical protein